MAKGNPNPSTGFHKYSPEKHREISLKGSQAAARKKKNQKMMKEILENMTEKKAEALQDIFEENPDLIKQYYEKLFHLALVEEEQWAMKMISEQAGLDAPKKQHVEHTAEEMSVEDAQAILQNAIKDIKIVD